MAMPAGAPPPRSVRVMPQAPSMVRPAASPAFGAPKDARAERATGDQPGAPVLDDADEVSSPASRAERSEPTTLRAPAMLDAPAPQRASAQASAGAPPLEATPQAASPAKTKRGLTFWALVTLILLFVLAVAVALGWLIFR